MRNRARIAFDNHRRRMRPMCGVYAAPATEGCWRLWTPADREESRRRRYALGSLVGLMGRLAP